MNPEEKDDLTVYARNLKQFISHERINSKWKLLEFFRKYEDTQM